MLDSALDCIVAMDSTGVVTEFNRAAQKTFGYQASEVIGRTMADVIVPPALREAHRAGLERLLGGAPPRILNQRLELTGMRSDGSEFPVELTVTRIPDTEPPEFTGFIRDISDKVAAAAEQRSLRRRLVSSADAERQRLVRDLHDGAQQRLIAVAMNLQLVKEQVATDPDLARTELDEASNELLGAVDDLRELARGLHPATLAANGLKKSIEIIAKRSPIPVTISVEEPECSELIQSTVYFFVAEALANCAKHSEASGIAVTVAESNGNLFARIADDGMGGASTGPGSGLAGLEDRVLAIGGTFMLTSLPGAGTTLEAVIPCES